MINTKQIQDYARKMIEGGRFLSIVEDGKATLLAFYSVCDDPQPYIDNIDHQFLKHNPSGSTVVIEEMTCKNFSKAYAERLHDELCKKYPNLKRGMWRRRREGRKDKIYTLWRRHGEVQHTS